MIFSVVIFILISVAAPEGTSTIPSTVMSATETQQPSSSTVQSTHPPDTSESQTTTQPIIVQQTTQMDVTNNTQTATSQSTWNKTSELTTSELKITAVNSSEMTFPAEPNSTANYTALGDRKEQYLATNPGLVAVLCIFCIVVAVVVVVVIVKTVRSRRPQFERLDDVPMGKVNEEAPFARYPPK
ncbi:protein CIST1-like [Carassius carassius]|uniref:protein CIST1-like n=1 Tax=Carassius carassius TaxID=217509 RepID=UPI00286919BF|nr:protein CIST1-like [Carassius carassius]